MSRLQHLRGLVYQRLAAALLVAALMSSWIVTGQAAAAADQLEVSITATFVGGPASGATFSGIIFTVPAQGQAPALMLSVRAGKDPLFAPGTTVPVQLSVRTVGALSIDLYSWSFGVSNPMILEVGHLPDQAAPLLAALLGPNPGDQATGTVCSDASTSTAAGGSAGGQCTELHVHQEFGPQTVARRGDRI